MFLDANLRRFGRSAQNGEPCGGETNLLRDDVSVPDARTAARERHFPDIGKIPAVGGRDVPRFSMAAIDCQTSTSLRIITLGCKSIFQKWVARSRQFSLASNQSKRVALGRRSKIGHRAAVFCYNVEKI